MVLGVHGGSHLENWVLLMESTGLCEGSVLTQKHCCSGVLDTFEATHEKPVEPLLIKTLTKNDYSGLYSDQNGCSAATLSRMQQQTKPDPLKSFILLLPRPTDKLWLV